MTVLCSDSDFEPDSEPVQPKLCIFRYQSRRTFFSPSLLGKNESKDCSVSVWVQRCDFKSGSGLKLPLALCQACCERLPSPLGWGCAGGGVRLLGAGCSPVPLGRTGSAEEKTQII